jgi:hypothetical protein
MEMPTHMRGIGRRAHALGLLVSLAFCAPAWGQCPNGGLSGTISACTADGSTPSGDAFDQACDVYLRAAQSGGGPKSGLPAGEYVFQVTDPSGSTLLSLAGPQNGVLVVASGQGGFSSYTGSHQTTGDGAKGELRVQVCPFASTPNPGGVHKLWLTPRDCYEAGRGAFGFLSSKSKTHTFKVTGAPPPAVASLVIRRFCDSDADGDGAGELLQDRVRYMVSVSSIDGGQPFQVVTGSAGKGMARLDGIPTPADYSVVELVPGTSLPDCWWYGTVPALATTSASPKPAGFTGTLGAGALATLTFGAACVCQATDGMSRFDYLLPSTAAQLEADDPQWRNVIDDAQFVTADGSAYSVPAGTFRDAYADFSAWLLSDGSPNAAYRLSTEAAAALLAEYLGALDADVLRVVRPGTAACLGRNTVTARGAVSTSEALIATDGFTPPGDRNAVDQECMLKALEGLNSKALPVVSGRCCEVSYP